MCPNAFVYDDIISLIHICHCTRKYIHHKGNEEKIFDAFEYQYQKQECKGCHSKPECNIRNREIYAVTMIAKYMHIQQKHVEQGGDGEGPNQGAKEIFDIKY